MSRQEDLEKQALKLIIDKGAEGILQRDLWELLDASSREGSRISLRLEERNLIRRARELANGRWTYRLFIKKRPHLKMDSLLDVPCTVCGDISKCEIGGEVSPNACAALTQWLLSRSGQS